MLEGNFRKKMSTKAIEKSLIAFLGLFPGLLTLFINNGHRISTLSGMNYSIFTVIYTL